jgi:hypothetical protein
LSSLVIALAVVPARADGDSPQPAESSPRTSPPTSPWIDSGGAVPVPAGTPEPDPGISGDLHLTLDPTPVKISSRRKWGSLAAVGGVYAAASTYMYFAWYHGQPGLDDFKWAGDGYFGQDTYAGGSDKLGHAWANAFWSRITADILLWGGWSRTAAASIASGLTIALFTYVEIKDGYYYEFSPGDEIANTLGAVMTALAVKYPRFDELFDFRVEYFPSRQYLDLLDGKRPPEDPTMPHQISLNIVEDYSGQRYLLALHLGALPPLRDSTWAQFVDVAVGYETHGYKPDPIEPVDREQHLFLGVSLNAQGLFDWALGPKKTGFGRHVGHLALEFFNVPFTSAAVAGSTRSPDR